MTNFISIVITISISVCITFISCNSYHKKVMNTYKEALKKDYDKLFFKKEERLKSHYEKLYDIEKRKYDDARVLLVEKYNKTIDELEKNSNHNIDFLKVIIKSLSNS